MMMAPVAHDASCMHSRGSALQMWSSAVCRQASDSSGACAGATDCVQHCVRASTCISAADPCACSSDAGAAPWPRCADGAGVVGSTGSVVAPAGVADGEHAADGAAALTAIRLLRRMSACSMAAMHSLIKFSPNAAMSSSVKSSVHVPDSFDAGLLLCATWNINFMDAQVHWINATHKAKHAPEQTATDDSWHWRAQGNKET